MPLRAYINNHDIISIDQTDDQWKKLKKEIKSKVSVLRLPCCGQEGFLRTSSLGLKHFVHAKSQKNCNWKPESPDHLRAKVEIYEACKENGWFVLPEYSGENWRADVFAQLGNVKIAFEVQWSKQTLEETKYRQERYAESNVRGCWFFRTPPNGLVDYSGKIKATKDIPCFALFKNDDTGFVTEINDKQVSLKESIGLLLNRKVKYCENVRIKPLQNINIIIFETSCWKCGESQHLWAVEHDFKSVCQNKFHLIGSSWSSDSIDKNETIYKYVKEFTKTEEGKHIIIGELKERYSRTVNRMYLSHGCFRCDAIFGDFHLNTEKIEAHYYPNNLRITAEVDFGLMLQHHPHWCATIDGSFCE